MKITAGGTLLMSIEKKFELELKAQTIVSLGPLIGTLGYRMSWSQEECILVSPEGRCINLQVQGGCPHLQEMEALSLIASWRTVSWSNSRIPP